MRKIERMMADAIRERRSFQCRNTRVDIQGDEVVVSLHGNEIARLRGSFLTVSSCGWRTSTTKSRLNAVLQAVGFQGSVYQTKRQWFLWQSPSAMRGRAVSPSMPFDDGMVILMV